MLYRLQPAVVAAQTFSTLDRHAVNDVVDQPAVELVEVIEPAAAESGQSAAEQTQPDVAGVPVHVDRGHGLERQPVFLLPAPDLAGPLVVAGQAVLGADPHLRSIGLHGEDMVAGQAVSHGEMLPFRINKRQCICGNLRDLGGRQCRHFRGGLLVRQHRAGWAATPPEEPETLSWCGGSSSCLLLGPWPFAVGCSP